MIYSYSNGRKSAKSNKYLELTPFMNLFHGLSKGFRETPKGLYEYNIKFCISHVYDHKNTSILDQYNETQKALSRIKKEKYIATTTVTPLQFAELAISIHKENLYLKDNFVELLEETQRTRYTNILSKIEKCKRDEAEIKFNIAFDILEITHGLLDNIIWFCAPADEIIKNADSIVSFFSTRSFKLANGNLDYRKIQNLLKKNFALDIETSIIYASHLIDEIINRRSAIASRTRSTYESGHSFEQVILESYNAIGYSVFATTATGDFGIDVIAKSNCETIGIQCKNYSGSVGVDAVMQAHSGGHYYNCTRHVVVSTNGFTTAAHEMAKKLNVELLTFKGHLQC